MRTASLAIVLGLLVGLGVQAVAAEKSHKGEVVSVNTEKSQLVMTNKGDEHTHDIGSTAKITLDDKPVKLGDLKKGDKVTITTEDDGSVKSVEATRPK